MTTIITRELGVNPKPTPLTNEEMDQNFINLNEDKAEIDGSNASGTWPINITGTAALESTGVIVGTYGSSTNIPQINVDEKGRITEIVNIPVVTTGLQPSDIGVTVQGLSQKNTANGYAGLDSSGLVPSSLLPSYVDDVLEYANLASFPASGTTGKIYVALDTNKTYRWSGSAYVEISASPGSTDSVTEGSTNLYFTNTRARAAISVTQNLTYNATTGVITGPNLSSYLTSVPAATLTVIGAVYGKTDSGTPYNTFIGYQTGRNVTSTYNTAIGNYTLPSATTGSNNDAFGSGALYNTSTGSYNTAIGGATLFSNTTSSNNVALGYYAGYKVTGANNIIIGYGSGYNNNSASALTTGTNNIIIGYNAVSSSATVSNENTFGNSSTTSNRFWGDMKMGGTSAGTTGQVLTSAGAGASPTWSTVSSLTGSTQSASPYKTLLGDGAALSLTGVNGTFIGYQAGYSATTGTNNTGVGYQALYSATTNSYNTAIGTEAMRNQGSLTQYAVAIGYRAMYTNNVAGQSVAIGYQALFTGAQSSCAIGYQALYNSTGSYCNSFGTESLKANITGQYNSAFGYRTLYTCAYGSYNSAFGETALGLSTGDYNTAIGYYSGGEITTGTQNTIIGAKAGTYTTTKLTSGSNNILIGYDARASSSTVSNENTFGNSSTTSNRFWGDMKMGGTSAGTTGQVLTSAGAGAAPTWTSLSTLTIGTGLTGTSYTPTAATTIALATSGITAGTYRSITVDSYGRATAGSNPTTLSGYGITDAAALSGATFTGGISGTSASFSGGVSGSSGTFSGGVSGTSGTFTGNFAAQSTSTFTGAATFNGGLSSTTGSFSGNLTLSSSYTETIYAVSGSSPGLSPTNGTIQTWTLSSNSTPTAGTWSNGQSITLMIDDGAGYTITWTSLAVTWKTNAGSAPTLNTTGYTAITLWKTGNVIYGARVGDA